MALLKEFRWTHETLPRTTLVPNLSVNPTAPFDLSAAMQRLTEDIAQRCEEFTHLRVAECLFAITISRSSKKHGVIADVTPMRTQGGGLTKTVMNREYEVQRFYVGDQEMMYIVTFHLPRFLNLPFEEKLTTLFHELYHISPTFNGDIRRHQGRYAIHTHSKPQFEVTVRKLAHDYLNKHDTPEVFSFLHHTTAQLLAKHGGVRGVRTPRPKLLPVKTG